ncbi:ABC transporter substrate-binding protein [Castellaniella sp.]|uniref:ABC transporter substrate-binding protein n=1 Tax=Castellaniella sp. TaxID=1955812 RepID=UPI003C70993A
MKTKTWRWMAGLALVSFGLTAQAADPIKIGTVLSITGPAAFLGDPEAKTLQMYVEKINKEGGILNRQLELVSYDDSTDASKANSFTKRLIHDDQVDAIIGGTTTGATMSMVPLVQKAEIPFMSLAGAVVVIDPVKKWVFKTPHTDRMAAEKVFEDMKKRGLTKIALMSETSGYGQSGKKESEHVAPQYGIEIVAQETYGPKDTDMTPQLTNIKNNPDVQAVLVFGLGQGPALVQRNYRQLGITFPIYESHGVCSDEFIKLAREAAEGTRLPCSALIVAEDLPDSDRQKSVVTSYADEYQKRWKTDVSAFGGHAYDALMLYIDAVMRAGTTDTAKVLEALNSTKGVMGTGGEFNLSPTDHMGLDLTAFRLLEIKNGQWTLVD